jgi:hypothetical protein
VEVGLLVEETGEGAGKEPAAAAADGCGGALGFSLPAPAQFSK